MKAKSSVGSGPNIGKIIPVCRVAENRIPRKKSFTIRVKFAYFAGRTRKRITAYYTAGCIVIGKPSRLTHG